MKEPLLIPSVKFNREYFTIGRPYVIYEGNNVIYGILTCVDDKELDFAVYTERSDEFKGTSREVRNYGVTIKSVEAGKTQVANMVIDI